MQYDVYPHPSPRMRARYPCVLELQSDLLADWRSRMVAPLSLTGLPPSSLPQRLCPLVEVGGLRPMRVPFEAAPLDKTLLKNPVASLRYRAHGIVAAVDTVLSEV